MIKIKHLSKEITRKEVMIKELKSNCENYKTTRKKILDENENLVEKNKVQKIDIQRKDLIIKDLKEKVKSLNANIEKASKIQQDSFTSSQSNTHYQKLKSENDELKKLQDKNVISDNTLLNHMYYLGYLNCYLTRGSLVELTKKRCTLSLEEFRNIIDEIIKLRNENI